MIMESRDFFIRFRTNCVILFVCLFAGFASAQMTLLSSSPAQGSVSVDTNAVLSLTFSEPLDTTVEFDGFFLGIELMPERQTGEPDSITLSADSATVFFHNVHLHEDTDYVLMLTGAMSASGNALDRPYTAAFSTGASLPANRVSGTISFPGDDPLHTVVALIPVDGEEFEPSALSVVTSGDGSYEIPCVADGQYLGIAIKDTDEDGLLMLGSADAAGIYDPNQDSVFDTLLVNGDVAGVDITLSGQVAQTAGALFPQAAALAQTQAPDAALVMVMSEEMEESGLSANWIYFFMSETENRVYYIISLGNFLLLAGEEEALSGLTSVLQAWIDSDAAMTVAEANGGSAFRAVYDDWQVMAIMGYSIGGMIGGDEESSGLKTASSTQDRRFGSLSGLRIPYVIDRFDLTALAQIEPHWFFQYESETCGESLEIFVNAVSGTLFLPQTARVMYNMAFPQVSQVDPGAKLALLFSFDIDVDGTSKSWIFQFYSDQQDSIYGYVTYGPFVMSTGSEQVEGGTPPVQGDWIDSDVALQVAEDAGGEAFRNGNAGWSIGAILANMPMYWIFDAAKSQAEKIPFIKFEDEDFMIQQMKSLSEQAVWSIHYHAPEAYEPPSYFVDALTGDLLTSVENSVPENLPMDFSLHPNYPNPFNPGTRIDYDIPVKSEVNIRILDILGREVDVLVSENHDPGRYHVIWNARDGEGNPVGSGAYLCEMKSGSVRQVQRLMLIR